MKPIELKGEMEHFTAYDEYDTLKESTDSLIMQVCFLLLHVVCFMNIL
jgi:hypothetical protein